MILPVKIKFIEKPELNPMGTYYKRVWWVLWLIHVAIPVYELMGNMVVEITFSDGTKLRHTVLKGYKCDLASIPRFLWIFWTPDGVYRYIAVLHDILYQAEVYARKLNDKIFRKGITLLPEQEKTMFYLAVRAGGWIPYKSHTKQSIAEAKQYLITEDITNKMGEENEI